MTTFAPLPTTPYRPRATSPLGIEERAGWTIKVSGISATDDLPNRAAVEAALDRAKAHLPQPPTAGDRSGIAFLIVHSGEEALWVIIGWWRQDLLYHRVFRADLGTTALLPVPITGPSACVWELLVIDHERRAWVEHVLTRPHDPDFDGYLRSTVDVVGGAA